jgi:hypothetical protein
MVSYDPKPGEGVEVEDPPWVIDIWRRSSGLLAVPDDG